MDSSKLLPYDVSAVDMQNELQLLSGVGNVSVTRTDADNVGGYTWVVTYLTAVGNQSALTFTNLLTGSGSMVQGAIVQEGNALGGSYILKFQELLTVAIPFTASAAVVQAALTTIVGFNTVVRSAYSDEGGSVYTVTYKALQGDLPLLVPYFRGSLTGVGAVVKVLEVIKGATASGSALR